MYGSYFPTVNFIGISPGNDRMKPPGAPDMDMHERKSTTGRVERSSEVKRLVAQWVGHSRGRAVQTIGPAGSHVGYDVMLQITDNKHHS